METATNLYRCDLYAAGNDNANATMNYKRSLALKETAETRQMLEKTKEK